MLKRLVWESSIYYVQCCSSSACLEKWDSCAEVTLSQCPKPFVRVRPAGGSPPCSWLGWTQPNRACVPTCLCCLVLFMREWNKSTPCIPSVVSWLPWLPVCVGSCRRDPMGYGAGLSRAQLCPPNPWVPPAHLLSGQHEKQRNTARD